MNGPDQGFGKCRRLRRKSEIDAVFASSSKVSSGGMAIRYAVREPGCSRVAIITGKRWGNAVERNRLRRIAREVFRKWHCPEAYSVDVVVSQYRSFKNVPGSQVARVIGELLGMIRKQQ